MYAAALAANGVARASVTGVASRALRYGWQCWSGGRLAVYRSPFNRTCRREGLEQLRFMAQNGTLGGAVVIALGTNDAGIYTTASLRAAHLTEVRRLVGGRPIYLVSVVALRPSVNERMVSYNRDVAAWCATDRACRVIDWAATPAAANPATYSGDGIHLSAAGMVARASFIARQVVRLADAVLVPRSAPASVAATPTAAGAVVTWAAVAPATNVPIDGYVVVVDGRTACATPASTRTCAVSGLANGVEHLVVVRAVNSAGRGPASAAVRVVPFTVPSVPVVLSAVRTDVPGTALVTWEAAAANGRPVDGYRVTLLAADGGPALDAVGATTLLVGPDDLQCNFEGLADGSGYSIVVEAHNAAGWSAASVATPIADVPPAASTN